MVCYIVIVACVCLAYCFGKIVSYKKAIKEIERDKERQINMYNQMIEQNKEFLNFIKIEVELVKEACIKTMIQKEQSNG